MPKKKIGNRIKKVRVKAHKRKGTAVKGHTRRVR
jgi:hypothetical protein